MAQRKNWKHNLPPVNVSCLIQETNMRQAHIYEPVITFNYEAKICILLSPCNIIILLTTCEGCVRRLYVIRGDLFKASVVQIWISEP